MSRQLLMLIYVMETWQNTNKILFQLGNEILIGKERKAEIRLGLVQILLHLIGLMEVKYSGCIHY